MILFKNRYTAPDLVTINQAVVLANVKFNQFQGITVEKVKAVNKLFDGVKFKWNVNKNKLEVI